MIPIRFRLNENEKLIYINKILELLENKEILDYNNKIESLLIGMKKKGYAGSDYFIRKAKKYKTMYLNKHYLCMWLVLTYEEIDDIRYFIWENIIKNDLSSITKDIHMYNIKLKELNNYVDLKNRRLIAYKDIRINSCLKNIIEYDRIYNDFIQLKKIYREKFTEKNINNWIMDITQVNVCPYCNLAYTYNRGVYTTAQLDHFFSKAEYPMFSLCFYNLIPSCTACNHIKSNKQVELISPYKKNAFEKLKISWEYNKHSSNGIKYNNKKCLTNLEKDIKIVFRTSSPEEKNNITAMNIDDAYNQHKDYASEIVKKVRIFSNKDTQNLIIAMGKKVGIRTSEVERFYLGNYVDENQLGKRILSKLTNDFYKEYLEYKKEI